jgi:transcriptional regulator NrdR
VRRRRECSHCGHRFTTFERREAEPLYVIKRGGDHQRFDRTKLRAALFKAAHKRPVTASDIESIVDRIEAAVGDGRSELSSERIGELCLEELRELDLGAYLQFAGTLAEPASAISGQPMGGRPASSDQEVRRRRETQGGSVRPPRKDAELPAKAASRKGLDE